MKKIVLVLSALAIAVPVFAKDGFSGELLLGSAKQEVTSSGAFIPAIGSAPPFSASFSHVESDRSNSFGVRGGYQFGEYFATELSYQQYGKLTGIEWKNGVSSGPSSSPDTYILNSTFNAKSFDLGIKGILPLTTDFSMNVRLGLANWRMKFDTTTTSDVKEKDESSYDGIDVYYGIGAKYKINQHFFVGLNYSMLTMKGGDQPEDMGGAYNMRFEHEVQNTSLSVGMSF